MRYTPDLPGGDAQVGLQPGTEQAIDEGDRCSQCRQDDPAISWRITTNLQELIEQAFV